MLSEQPSVIAGLRFTVEYLQRIASRVSAREITDSSQAYDIVRRKAVELGFEIPYARCIDLGNGSPSIVSGSKTFVFALHSSLDCDHSELERICRVWRALEWLEENGLPEVRQVPLITAEIIGEPEFFVKE